MREHVKADEPFERSDVTVEEALELFRAEDQHYKVELIEDLVATPTAAATHVSLYRNGPFLDLCRGPHAPATGRSAPSSCSRSPAPTGAATPTARCSRASTAPRSSTRRSWPSTSSASSRPRRATTAGSARSSACSRSAEVSPGAAFWLPKGTALFNQLVALNRAMQAERGYVEVKTPQLYECQLWETCGHWGKYKENMFVTRVRGPRVRRQADELPRPRAPVRAAALELPRPAAPLRRAGPAAPPRAERHAARPAARAALLPGRRPHLLQRGPGPGRGRGLPGVRRSTSTSCSASTLRLELSTRPERPPRRRRALGPGRGRARGGAARAAASSTRSTRATAPSTAPKIDLHMTDSLGRSWQLGTVQLDYNLPERFGLTTPAPTTPSTGR